MLESMKVALTLVSNFVPKKYLIKYGLISDNGSVNNTKDNKNNCKNENTSESNSNNCNSNEDNKTKYSFHIHCPDGATPKDGPSAGCAISLGLISLLTEIPIRNDRK